MTSRQLALMHGGLPEDALISLPMSDKASAKDKPLTQEQQRKKQEALLRRKVAQEKRDEEAKTQTISKLLSKKDVKETASLKMQKAHVGLHKSQDHAKHSLIRFVSRCASGGAKAESSASAPQASLKLCVAFPVGDRSFHEMLQKDIEYVLCVLTSL